MNTIGGIITLSLVLVVLFLPRRWATLGVMSGVCYLTEGQVVDLFGFNLTAIRFILLAGFIRVVVRKEFSFSDLNEIDRILLIFLWVSFLVFALRSFTNVKYGLGQLFNSLLTYFLFRGLLDDPNIFRQFLKDTVLLITPFALFMIIEATTGRNYFAIMGGVLEVPMLRDGYYRCQATFRSPITAGTFGASMFPLYVSLAFSAVGRFFVVIGIALVTSITIASHSSGPLMAFIFGFTAWLCWPLRDRMRRVRWAIVFSLISFTVVMKAPVWFIFARISDVVGGDGWHRSNLIDKFINNFPEWWLTGLKSEKTADWAATTMPWGGVDVTNQYVSVGLSGGLISLILFIALFKKSYQLLGNAMKKIREDTQDAKREEALLWGIGSALFATIVNFFAVTYFDQIYVIWYMLLAVISGCTEYFLRDNVSWIDSP